MCLAAYAFEDLSPLQCTLSIRVTVILIGRSAPYLISLGNMVTKSNSLGRSQTVNAKCDQLTFASKKKFVTPIYRYPHKLHPFSAASPQFFTAIAARPRAVEGSGSVMLK